MSTAKLKKKYRTTTKLMDILEIIHEAKSTEGNFLWHQHEGQRLIYPIQITDFKIEADRVFIAIENKSVLFAKDQTLYLRFHARDAVCKTTIHNLNDLEVILNFPKEVLAFERRKHKRHPFHLSDEKTLHIQLAIQTATSGPLAVHALRTLDISEAGASLFLPTNLKDYFTKDTPILVDSIGDHKLNPAIPGMIVSQFPHTLNRQNAKEAGFKIGLNLEQSFPEAQFTKFLVRPSLFTIEDERLALDTVFRDKVHESMSSTLKKLTTQRSTGRIFQKIQFDRADPDYVQLHIKLLCEVLCGVGIKVGWVSEKTLDKLIYVAYMHDVSLFNKPKLAKIKNKQELDATKNISAGDRKLYLNSPLYSAELARLDQQSYPDVVKILIQQRELPDGSGFPYGIGGVQLTPLSCLFIFAHYFVDYMIETPEWTLESFIKTYQRLLKGAYFTKIFQSLH